MKEFIKFIVIFAILISANIFAQVKNTIQVNGGLMSATDSDKGILGTIQFNYEISGSFSLYAYSGILYWNNNNVGYYKGDAYKINGAFSNIGHTYSEDSHKLIPVYIGAKYFFNNSSAFRPFVNIEVGFSYLTYNSYYLQSVDNPDGTIVLLPINKSVKNDIFFGAGMGIGACHDIGDKLELLLEYRFNMLKNSEYEWLSSGRTLRFFQFGFAYKL
jgi:outer membrane protein W